MSADVLFVLHPRIDPQSPHIQGAVEALMSRGKSVEVFHRGDAPGQAGRFEGNWRLSDEHVEGCQLIVTFGGDGTFLHAARTAISHETPVLGVNLGRLGFLAWVELADAPHALAAWADGETEVETRATLLVESDGDQFVAINEAALLKEPTANVIQVDVSLDGTLAGRFHADGAVVATPTGSTAYAASAGGPILDPRVDAMVVVPLNPHTLATRALVLPARHPVQLRVDERTRLLLDGSTDLVVEAHAAISCTLDGPLLKVVRSPGTFDFYWQLREKMGWGEPLVRDGTRVKGGDE
jgi:NAD+ kinase